MGRAIKPNNIFPSIPALVDDKPEVVMTDEEKALASLARHSGWEVLKTYIGNLSNELDLINDAAVEKGLPFEEIGKNTVIIKLSMGILKKAVNKVEDAKDAVEKSG